MSEGFVPGHMKKIRVTVAKAERCLYYGKSLFVMYCSVAYMAIFLFESIRPT